MRCGFVTVRCAFVIGEDARAARDGEEAQTDYVGRIDGGYGFEKVAVRRYLMVEGRLAFGEW